MYEAHCIECHSTNMHWRDNRQATDWQSLKGQVRRWQAAGRLGWKDDDITEVAHYLNDTIYHYPWTVDRTVSTEATQRSYDIGPQQRMYAKGEQVPAYAYTAPALAPTPPSPTAR